MIIEAIFMLVAGVTAVDVPDNVKSIIQKTQSFGVGYPISFWNYTNLTSHGQYMNEAEVAEWADVGFTVPQSPNYNPNDLKQKAQILNMLDWAGKYGMKLILCDPRCYVSRSSEYADGVRSAVADFGKHSALFGFHVGDEPDADMKEAFFECYRIQKEIAPDLNPFANLLPFFPGIEKRAGTDTWANYLDEFSTKSNADLLSYDCYIQMNQGDSGWNSYFENLRLYREASLRNGIPFWNTLLSVGHFRYRCPNFDEIRWQFNTTLACGANGILWFFYYMREPHENYRLAPIDENWEKTQGYHDIRRVQKDFHKRYGSLFSRLVCTKVMFYPKAYGSGEDFAPDGIVSKVSPDIQNHPILIGEFTDVDGRRYVMIVNNSMTENVNVGVTFPGKDAKAFTWNWSGVEFEGGAFGGSDMNRDDNGLNIRHWLAPGQEAVYRIESESASKEPITLTK